MVAVLAVFLVTVCLFVGVFWWNGRAYSRVTFPQTYYFLVRECEDTTAAAVAGQVYLSGGAGYLIETSGAQSVVLACYFKETSAQSVQRTMREKGIETDILTLSPPDLALNGKLASYRSRISANAQTADTCARLLYDTANGLERTDVTQEEARAAVRGVVKSLKGLCVENGEGPFARWNAALSEAARKGTEIAEGILFAKDVRYMQVQLCYSVANIANYFP